MLSLDKKYFQRLIESSPDIIIAVDKSGTVNYYNDGARTSLGYSSEEIIGEGLHAHLPVARRGAPRHEGDARVGRQGPYRQLRDRLPQQGRRDHPGDDHRLAHPRRRRQRDRLDRLRARYPPHASRAAARDRRRNRGQPRARDQQSARIDHQQSRAALAIASKRISPMPKKSSRTNASTRFALPSSACRRSCAASTR